MANMTMHIYPESHWHLSTLGDILGLDHEEWFEGSFCKYDHVYISSKPLVALLAPSSSQSSDLYTDWQTAPNKVTRNEETFHSDLEQVLF